MTDILKHPALKLCYELSLAIERIPCAGSEQTDAALLADKLERAIDALVDEARADTARLTGELGASVFSAKLASHNADTERLAQVAGLLDMVGTVSMNRHSSAEGITIALLPLKSHAFLFGSEPRSSTLDALRDALDDARSMRAIK